MNIDIKQNKEYANWINQLKEQFRQSQVKAVVSVNSEMLLFYWNLGRDIVEKQKTADWGDKIISQISIDLQHEFPEVKGFSKRNIEYMRRCYLFYNQDTIITQQPVAQLEDTTAPSFLKLITSIPWGHSIATTFTERHK